MNIPQKIWQYIWLGFHSEAEIQEMMMEDLWNTYFDYKTNADKIELRQQEVTQSIQKYTILKAEQEKNWAVETMVDRLELAFEEMHDLNIIALHVAGEDYEHALENIQAIFQEEYAEEEIETVTFCFYSEQDVHSLLPSFENAYMPREHSLVLHLGNMKTPNQIEQQIKNKMIEILRQCQFSVQSNENNTIELQNFQWQNRYQEWDDE